MTLDPNAIELSVDAGAAAGLVVCFAVMRQMTVGLDAVSYIISRLGPPTFAVFFVSERRIRRKRPWAGLAGFELGVRIRDLR